MALCVHQLQMQGVRVETALATGLSSIRGNSNQLRQVLLNLMLNAGQAMESSPLKLITVSTASPEAGFVEIKVGDTGPGLAEDVKEKLFKPFFTTKRRGQGTGLGLSVSRSIIEAHRGSIRAEGAPGARLVFVVPGSTALEAERTAITGTRVFSKGGPAEDAVVIQTHSGAFDVPAGDLEGSGGAKTLKAQLDAWLGGK